MKTEDSKARRDLRWIVCGLLLKLALFGGAWALAAGAQQIANPPL